MIPGEVCFENGLPENLVKLGVAAADKSHHQESDAVARNFVHWLGSILVILVRDRLKIEPSEFIRAFQFTNRLDNIFVMSKVGFQNASFLQSRSVTTK